MGNFKREVGAGSYGCLPILAFLGWPGMILLVFILAVLYLPVLGPHQTPEGIPTDIYYTTGDVASGSSVLENRVSWETYRWDPEEGEWIRDDVNTRAADQSLTEGGYYHIITTWPSRVFRVTRIEPEELEQWDLLLPPPLREQPER